MIKENTKTSQVNINILLDGTDLQNDFRFTTFEYEKQ